MRHFGTSTGRAGWRAGGLALATCLLAAGCDEKKAPTPPPPTPAVVAPALGPGEVNPARLGIFGKPLPPQFDSPGNPLTEEKVALGRMLFYDKRLSKNQDISCNTCHDLKGYGVDSKKTSSGHKAQTGTRNSPTVYNAAGHFVQFWDGREPTIESQAGGPMVNPVEMANSDPKKIEAVLQSIPGYAEPFKKAFPGDPQPVSIKNATAAIGAFERRLTTPSRFDKYLAGDKTALTEAERIGLNKFLDTGCTTCHLGTLLGGSMYQKVGLAVPWPSQTDPGRFLATKNEADRMMFKVPSLRNIAKTGPYFHDGTVEKLGDAVRMMAHHQLAKELSEAEITSVVAFLGALSGELPEELIKEPALPPSGKLTPKPDPT